jgi:hypothetical protein
MGLGSDAITLLIELKKAGHIGDASAVMEIGAQQLANSFLEYHEGLDQLAKLFGVSAPRTLPQRLATHIAHGDLEHLNASAPRAEAFWRWLGFTYASIDIDGSPGSISLDLNYDDVPEAAQGKYALVTNFGTTEHVANQLNAFKVIHELTAREGVMIHHLPAQGMFNHGLVNYNPKFFRMLERSNGYRLLHMNFISSESAYTLPQNIQDDVIAYHPHAARRLGDYKASDCAVVVALKKRFDLPFVAPIDVPTGTNAHDKLLEDRYWTVFKPIAFRKYKALAILASLLAKVKNGFSG